VERGRLGRSLQDLVAFLGEVHAQGVDLYLDRQGVETTTPGGKALFQMMGVFAELERGMILERVCAGLEKARAKGERLGRPKVTWSVERSRNLGSSSLWRQQPAVASQHAARPSTSTGSVQQFGASVMIRSHLLPGCEVL
jgi:Resolvase, N terminal domain